MKVVSAFETFPTIHTSALLADQDHLHSALLHLLVDHYFMDSPAQDFLAVAALLEQPVPLLAVKPD